MRRMTTDLAITLLTRINGNDVIVLEPKYHLSCLTAFRNSYHSFLKQGKNSGNDGKESRIESRMEENKIMVSHVDNSSSGVKSLH